MKRVIGMVCVLAVAAVVLLGCPPGTPKFKIRIENNSTGTDVTSVVAVKFSDGGLPSPTSEELLPSAVAAGDSRLLSIPLSAIGEGRGIKVDAGGLGLSREIQGGLVNGLIINVTVSGGGDIEITAE